MGTYAQMGRDSPVTFKANGHTVHDYDRRFQLEDDGIIVPGERFLWSMINPSEANGDED